jgi:hypothetical protein
MHCCALAPPPFAKIFTAAYMDYMDASKSSEPSFQMTNEKFSIRTFGALPCIVLTTNFQFQLRLYNRRLASPHSFTKKNN